MLTGEGLEQVKEAEAEADAAQRVLGPEDLIAADDEAEWRAFELARHLSELEAEAARQRAALEACVDEQWQAEAATCRIKKEIIDLDNE
jgi:hypothetical protein